MRSGGSETCSLTIARWRCREASPCRVQAPQPEAASGDRGHKTVITAPAELATSKSHTRDAWHNWARSQQPRPQDITVSRQQRFAHRAFSQHLPQKYASPARGSGRDVYDPVTIIVAYAPRHRCMGGRQERGDNHYWTAPRNVEIDPGEDSAAQASGVRSDRSFVRSQDKSYACRAFRPPTRQNGLIKSLRRPQPSMSRRARMTSRPTAHNTAPGKALTSPISKPIIFPAHVIEPEMPR